MEITFNKRRDQNNRLHIAGWPMKSGIGELHLYVKYDSEGQFEYYLIFGRFWLVPNVEMVYYQQEIVDENKAEQVYDQLAEEVKNDNLSSFHTIPRSS